MNTTFENRLQSQVLLEQMVGADSPEKLKDKKQEIEALVVSSRHLEALSQARENDLSSFFLKGLLSLMEAISGVSDQRYSWSLIKSYYSTYYFIRSIMLSEGYVLVKNGSGKIYYLPLESGSKIKSLNYQKRGEHQKVLKNFEYLFKDKIPLLSNSIDDDAPPSWLRDQREHIQYRQAVFKDPVNDLFFNGQPPSDLIFWIRRYSEDMTPVYCFDRGHAALAIPIECLKFLKSSASSNQLNPFIGSPKARDLKGLFPERTREAIQLVLR